MVRVTAFLARVPVIKFRKGGLGQSAGAPAATSAPKGCPVSSAPRQQAQPAAGMSTSIPDIDLPPRYQRQPLSQEEIDHINGGGIV